jgi:taurine dioxygenase
MRFARVGRLVSVACPSMAGNTQTQLRPYRLTPLPRFGAEVHGVDLSQNLPQQLLEAIKEDVVLHRLVVFRDQGIISGPRQVEISRFFGPLESTFYKHPASPHPDVFRVSNDPSQGCSGVGRTGWHVDGSFQRAPFAFAIYHIWSVSKGGDTVFAPLNDILNSLPDKQRARWERLWMMSDRRSTDAKPLVYTHPLSGLDTMCFHLGMTSAFIWDYGTERERVTNPVETAELLSEIKEVFEKTAPSSGLIYSHAWKPGDFIISDNAALGHKASKATQLPPEIAGLRVMHRTTIGGAAPPSKSYCLDATGCRIKKRF